jgi:RHS repeat-associated protein
MKITHKSDLSVIQADDYFPFGGQYNSYTSGDKNNYLYNGKELQEEMEWYDFGARMQDPWLGRWNRIDSKADEYTAISPYAYVANNPIMMIDPDGNDIVIIGERKYRAMVRKRIMNLAQTPEGARLVESLRNAEHVTVIQYGGSNVNGRYTRGKTVSGRNASWVYFDPESQGEVDGVKRTPETSLAHELRHAEQDFDGTNGEYGDPVAEYTKPSEGGYTFDADPYAEENNTTIKVSEIDAVNGTENKVRASLGLDIRESYDGFETINLVINGKEVTVGKNDYASVKGPAVTKAFQQLMGQIITGNVNITSLVDQFNRAKGQGGRASKRNKKGDAAEIYD